MATNYPTTLDTFVNPQGTDSVQLVSHAAQHANANDAIKQLEIMVGTSNSTDPNSHEYKINLLRQERLDQIDPSGFADITKSTIHFNNSNRTFTIAPTNTNFKVYAKSIPYTKTTESITIPNVSGMYYIHYNVDTCALDYKTSPFDFASDIPVAYVFWNASQSKATYFGEERHGIQMDSATHYYLHKVFGTQYASGLATANATIGGDGSSNSHAQFAITNGTIFDEDLVINITNSDTPTNSFEQKLSTIAKIPVFYRSGTNGSWTKIDATDYALPYGTLPQYNEFTGTTWQLTDATTNKYFATFIVATNNINEPIIAIAGQLIDSSYNSADANNQWSSLNLQGLPANELKVIHRILWQSGGTNVPKAAIVGITDLRSTLAGSAGASSNNHSALYNLTNDDHPQYVHVATARTITAVHTFNPPTAGPAFILGANAQGQKIVGLNADKLDGYDASDFVMQSSLLPTLGDYLTVSTFIYEKGNADGIATLDSTGKIPYSQIPDAVKSDAQARADAALSAAGAYTASRIAALVNSAPAVLDTLKELADSLANDPNFATTMTTALAGKSNVGHTHTSSNITDFVEAAQDAAGLLFNHNSHSNLTASYDDVNNKVILSVDAQLTQEQVQDYIAPLFTHGNNTNMNIMYDDTNNQLIMEAITEPSKAIMSSTAPLNPADGAFWLDTDEYRTGDTLALKIWNALANKWEYATSALSLATTNVWTAKNTFNQGVVIGLSSDPANPVAGQVYYNLVANSLRVYDGLVWKSAGGSSGGGLPSVSTDGTSVPTSLFFGLIAPPGGSFLEGDIWFDVDDLGTPFNQFYTGTTAPDPTQYEFWVDPALQTGELIYSANEPQTPQYTGELWIDTDDYDGQLIQTGPTTPDPSVVQLWVDTNDTDTPSYYSNLNFPTYLNKNQFPAAATKPGMTAVDSSTGKVYISINNIWVEQPQLIDTDVTDDIAETSRALIWMGFI